MGPIQRANIDCAVSGDNTIVPALPGRTIRVLALALASTGAAVDAFLSSGSSAGAALFGGTRKLTLDRARTAGSPAFVLPFNPAGWFETDSGEALNLNLAEYTGSSSSSSSSSPGSEPPAEDTGGVCGSVVYEING
jgi:hypothetical protein